MIYIKLIRLTVLIVILCSLIFFMFIGYSFGISDPLNRLTLTIYFFSGISTLGAVLAAIYTLYIQAKAKQPNFLLEAYNTHCEFNNNYNKHELNISIKMINTGESAFLLKISLKHKGENLNQITYGCSETQNQFDIFKSITEEEKNHLILLNFLIKNVKTMKDDILKLQPILVLDYKDKNHLDHKETYLIKQKKSIHSDIPFFNLTKIE